MNRASLARNLARCLAWTIPVWVTLEGTVGNLYPTHFCLDNDGTRLYVARKVAGDTPIRAGERVELEMSYDSLKSVVAESEKQENRNRCR